MMLLILWLEAKTWDKLMFNKDLSIIKECKEDLTKDNNKEDLITNNKGDIITKANNIKEDLIIISKVLIICSKVDLIMECNKEIKVSTAIIKEYLIKIRYQTNGIIRATTIKVVSIVE